jgi:hypothetical protein
MSSKHGIVRKCRGHALESIVPEWREVDRFLLGTRDRLATASRTK